VRFKAHERIPEPCPGLTDLLAAELGDDCFFVPAATVRALCRRFDLGVERLMVELVPVVKRLARPPISKYLVGAVGRCIGTSDLVLGVNLEFPAVGLAQTVHGEQFVVTRAHARAAAGLSALAVSAAPCGLCRQVLNELHGAANLRILVPGHKARRLPHLLPESFGPVDLGVASAMLAHPPLRLRIADGTLAKKNGTSDDPVQAALTAARRAYAPYSRVAAGCALRMRDGTVHVGSVLENAAYNPTIPPLQAALINLVAAAGRYDDIERVVLAEHRPGTASPSYVTPARSLVAAIAPKASLQVVDLRRS